MKNAKSLIDLNGKMNPVNFKSATVDQVYRWVLNNFDTFNLNDVLSCHAKLDLHHIIIKGDKDDRMMLITDLVIIDLDDHDCGCSKEEKKNCNNIICIDRRYTQN